MAQEICHLVCCVDNNYVPHCGVMLTSLLENNKDERIRVHVLDNALTEECRNVFALVALQAGFLIRVIGVLHVGAVAGFALQPAGNVAIGAEFSGRNRRSGKAAEQSGGCE